MSGERGVPAAGENPDPENPEPEDLGVEPEEAEEPEEPEETGGVEPPEPEPGAVRQPAAPGRGDRRIESLARRARELEDTNRLLMQRLLAQSAAPQQPQPDPARQAAEEQAELERVSMLAPHEQGKYWRDKFAQEANQRQMLTELRVSERIDRADFERLQRDEPAAKRLAARVEEMLVQARNAGMNPPREQIYNALLGEEVRTKARAAAARTVRTTERRTAAQTTQPGRPASGVPANRRPTGFSEEAFEAQFGDMPI